MRVDVPEVDREVGQQRLHVQALLIPPLQTGHRKRVSKGHQAGGASTVGRSYGQALAQPREPVVEGEILQVVSLFGHEKGLRQSIVMQVRSLRMVGA